MSIEDLLDEIGGLGNFQFLIIMSTIPINMFTAWSMLQMSYAGFIPNWHCKTTFLGYYDNVTFPRSNSTIEACQINNTWTDFNQMDCDKFGFDDSAVTVVTEWDLLCDRKWIKSAMTSIQMAGVLIGAFLAGQAADRFGRKKTLYAFVLFHSVMNIITAFSISWQMFAACRFFIGIGLGGPLVTTTPYPMEFMPLKWRTLIATLPSWAIGASIFAVIALLLENWSHLHLACGLFGLSTLVGFLYLPESLRWLIVQGRLKEAGNVCEKIAKFNRKEVPSTAKSLFEKIYHDEHQARMSSKKYTYIDVLRGWQTFKITFSFCFFWFSLSLIYYGMSFGVSSLAGNLYLNIFLLNIVEVPPSVSTFCTMNKFGRKWTVVVLFLIALLGALGCLVTNFVAPSSNKGVIITGLSLVTKLGVGAGWTAISAWGLELYPTVTRSLGFAMANTAARIGGIIAPFVIDFDYLLVVSYVIIGALNFLCVILAFAIPDTKGMVLSDSLATPEKKPVSNVENVELQVIDEKADVFTLKSESGQK